MRMSSPSSSAPSSAEPHSTGSHPTEPHTTRTRRARLPLAATAAVSALVLGLSGCAGAPEASSSASASSSVSKITLTNCGQKVTLDKPATRGITLNQGATEDVLAVGMEKSLVGTAYLDGAIPAKWQDAYKSVKVLAKEYPSKETFLAAKPDVAFASYSSAFTDKDGVGTREALAKQGIATYISPFGCPKGTAKADATWDNVYSELTDVATLLGKPEAAKSVITAQKAEVAAVEKAQTGKGLKVVWYDSGDKTPFLGGGTGGPQLILDAAGATNVFADQKDNWFDGSWEKVVAADPDVIVLADASWDTAAQKIKYLESDPVLKNLRAMKNKSFISLPFSATTPGAELADGAKTVSDGLAKIKK